MSLRLNEFDIHRHTIQHHINKVTNKKNVDNIGVNLHAKLIRNKGFSRWFRKMLPVSTKLGGTKWSRRGGGSPIFRQTS